jgi:hypothetical protein
MSFAPILSAVIGAVGTIVQASAAAQAANYQAKVEEMNAGISRDNATREIQASQLDQQQQDQQARALMGEQVAEQGASGLALGGRTQMLTRKSASTLARTDALNIRYAGELNKYNYMVDAANHTAAAEGKRQEASNSMLAGFIGAAGSLLGGSYSSGGSARSVKRSYTPAPVPQSVGLGTSVYTGFGPR